MMRILEMTPEEIELMLTIGYCEEHGFIITEPNTSENFEYGTQINSMDCPICEKPTNEDGEDFPIIIEEALILAIRHGWKPSKEDSLRKATGER